MESTRLRNSPPTTTVKSFRTSELLGPLSQYERKHAPERLFVAGRASLLRNGRRVSVIGSRSADELALRRARRLARVLAEHDITVVSGLAAGVDTAAHEAAIDAGGQTVGVLGTPLDTAYPRQNQALQDMIAARYALVSQFCLGSPTRRWNFPIRNRTMALLSAATVIVTAGDHSGTLHQGWEALRLGRDLLLMESLAKTDRPWIRKFRHYGAQVLSDGMLERWLETLDEPMHSPDGDAPF
ncbi:MAG: DNA-processing protein DprA [Bryobacterales bacterium]|nr:DNA-processing protein DprA [Bryobacterales bacterium]